MLELPCLQCRFPARCSFRQLAGFGQILPLLIDREQISLQVWPARDAPVTSSYLQCHLLVVPQNFERYKSSRPLLAFDPEQIEWSCYSAAGIATRPA